MSLGPESVTAYREGAELLRLARSGQEDTTALNGEGILFTEQAERFTPGPGLKDCVELSSGAQSVAKDTGQPEPSVPSGDRTA